MPGIRGLKRCQCDANRVFGWSARPKLLFDEYGQRRYTSFLDDAIGVVMPAVNAPYVVARGGVPVGATPKPDPNFSLGLPTTDTRSGYELGADESALSEVQGARVVYDDDGTPHVIYVLGKPRDVILDTGWGDGVPSRPCVFVYQNLRTSVGGVCYLPMNARLGLPQPGSASWYSNFLFGNEAIPGGGYVWHPPCIGFSRDTVVICDTNRVLDGAGNVMRYRFSDDSWSVGYGESATTDNFAYVCMPAQMSGDGQPWVLAKNYQTRQMFTGKWLNTLAYHGGNEPAEGAGGPAGIADLPAKLTTAEQINRLDNKPGWTADDDWVPTAYTRRSGFDYAIVTPRNELGYMTARYYDGRRGRWYDATDYRNIYAFDNGDVVLASPMRVKYINADRSTRWEWVAPQYDDGGPSARGYEAPFLSGNSEVVQVKNVSLVDKVTPPNYHDSDLVRRASTALLDTRKWTSHTAFTFCEVAVSLSRAGNPPTCVIHRSLDRLTVDDDGNPAAKKNYQTNFYATNETLDAIYDGDNNRQQSHHAFDGLQVGGMSFDCAPSCDCNCAISGQLAY